MYTCMYMHMCMYIGCDNRPQVSRSASAPYAGSLKGWYRKSMAIVYTYTYALFV